MGNNRTVYDTAAYYRLSKDDSDIGTVLGKQISDSISNQRNLIRDFIRLHPELKLYAERIDDGYSGSNFERPAFQEMMEDIKSGRVNCVVVKDLSRFGREYIETGRYIQRIFPALGIRFIAINDNYDSSDTANNFSQIYLPFKNLINDSYSRDTSVKIRSHLQIKRKQGEFTGAFAAYGYLKEKTNKNKLVKDDYASEIVSQIFEWKIEGFSQLRIAQRLNERGELSPMEYKKARGMKYQSSFKKRERALWSAVTVGRILKNELYIGVLQQGKRSTPNHKVRKTAYLEETDWIRAENTHEAIISKDTFLMVQELLKMDLRAAQNKSIVYLFSGLLVCGNCNESLVRKVNISNGKKYVYYICSGSRLNVPCGNHRISEEFLNELILILLNKHMETVVRLCDLSENIQFLRMHKNSILTSYERLRILEDELHKYEYLKMSLYENFAQKIIEEEEYAAYGKNYTERIENTKKNIAAVQSELQLFMSDNGRDMEWIKKFAEDHKLKKLERKILVMLIKKIIIHENKKIIIIPNYKNEFDYFDELLKNQAYVNADEEEVV